jgi:EAL domain-containing protein (putative c-di-GMP-specific phosphodiesterase class I)
VEKRAEAEFLEAQRCDEAQGYYFSRPLPPTQFGELLAAGFAEAVN